MADEVDEGPVELVMAPPAEEPEVEAVEPAEEAPEGEPEGDEPKPEKGLRDDKGRFKGNVQNRIDELTRRAHEAERRASKAEAALSSRPAEGASAKPTPDKYERYDEFVDALTDWKVDQRTTAIYGDSAKTAKEEATSARAEAWSAKVAAVSEAMPDYGEVVGKSDIPIAGHVAEALMEADHGPELAYHLATNPSVAERLNAMSPTRATIELGRIETTLTAPVVKAPTRAPAPISPVRAGSASKVDLVKADMDTYMAERRKQGARW